MKYALFIAGYIHIIGATLLCEYGFWSNGTSVTFGVLGACLILGGALTVLVEKGAFDS